jgi:tRNA (uracil-5-)-methyltransferase
LDNKPAIQIEPIVSAPSPVRNKCELTFGYKILSAEDGSEKVPAIGFKPSGWAGGVAFSNSLEIISPEVCVLVDVFNQFLLGSTLPPYDQQSHTGFWRTVTIRTSDRTLECMLIICHTSSDHVKRFHPTDSSGTTAHDLVKAEKEKLVDLLKSTNLAKDEANEPFRVTSIFFQQYDGASSPTLDHPVEVSQNPTVYTFALS